MNPDSLSEDAKVLHEEKIRFDDILTGYERRSAKVSPLWSYT